MGNRLIWAGVLLALVTEGTGHWALAAEPAGGGGAEGADEVAFPMKEMSIFEAASNASLLSDLTRGARAETQKEPHEDVKAYPKLVSKKPIYGVVRLAPKPLDRESGTPYYFVVDESGESGKEEPAKEEPEEEEEESSILDTLSAALGMKKAAPPVRPEPPKLNNTYDRLYLDLNGDLDLTNDPVITPMKEPPAGLVRRYSSMRQCVVFNEITVPLDFGEELGNRPVRLVPRLEVQEYEGEEYSGVGFMSAVARKGDVKFGGQTFQAVLAQRYTITGRYDNPYTGLLLTSKSDPNQREYWWGADQLSAMRLVDGEYYTTATTPLGDQLIVTRYQGATGVLKIDPGDRELDKCTIQGSLRSEGTAVAIGEPEPGRSTEPVSECRLPTGDYLPAYVTVQYGTLQIGISNNYHADGEPRGADHSKSIYGIQIREDKPFVWDFSTPPEVMFASPAKDQTFHPGDEITVNGVLVDPKLGIMIRRLTAKKSLDPKVTITNAAGKQIAEGPMPFG